jgi:outer membrane protein, multidrug efflux system
MIVTNELYIQRTFSKCVKFRGYAQIGSALALCFFINSCAMVGPEHSAPEMESAKKFKGFNPDYSSRISKSWWRTFGDSQLNSLMADLEKGNFDLRAAEGRRNQAYAALGIDRSMLYPQISSNASASRNRSTESDRDIVPGGMRTYYNDYRVSMSLGYEIDLWGRVRRIVEAGQANVSAAEISVDQVKLSLQAQLASSYFALRFIDSESAVLEQALTTRQESLNLARELLKAGRSSEVDVARAEAELARAKAQLVSIQSPRASLENAVAVLSGKNASNFSVPKKPFNQNAPSVSAGTPIELLGRRPDVFIAERKLAASSAEIGIATAQFYPKISLIGSSGFSSIKSSDFLQYSSSEFAIGPEIELPVFEGWKNKSTLALAKANHEEALANYQQTVLVAFADVENALAARRSAINEISAHQESVNASNKSFELSNTRYREGFSSYIEVIDSQREMLDAQLSEVQARGRSFAATVQLMQALGGGFSK